MLPRMNKNAVKIMIDSNDDAEDIQNKKNEAQRLLGIRVDNHANDHQFEPEEEEPEFDEPQLQPPQQHHQQMNPPYKQQQYGQQQPYNQPPQQQQYNQYGQPPQQYYSQQPAQYQPQPHQYQPQPQQYQPPQQFQQQPQQQPYQFNQYGNQPQGPGAQNQPKKTVEENKYIRKGSMDPGPAIGLTQQGSTGPRRVENNLDSKATIATNPYTVPQRPLDPYEQNYNKTIQMRPAAQAQQFQPSPQYGLPQNTYGQMRGQNGQMEVEPPVRNNYVMQAPSQPQPQQLPAQQQQFQPQPVQQQRQLPQPIFQKQPDRPQPPPQASQPQFQWDKVVQEFTNWHPSN